MATHRKKQTPSLRTASVWRRYAFAWVTGAFFLFSLVGHWTFAWFAYANEQAERGSPVEMSGYLVEVSRDTLENWQSEFLQLLWQVGGLSFLLYVGSPQSGEGDQRQEEKLDAILRVVDPKRADDVLSEIDRRLDRGA